ncbi:MAG: DEAD/DEAH box helicase family protein [Desulfurococcaceae archaeon TW002]
MSSNDLIVRYRGWMSEDDFRKIVEIAEYLGREGDELIFRISKHKLVSRRLTVDDVLGILDEVGLEYDKSFEERLREFFNRVRGTATILFKEGKLILSFDRYLGDIYQTHLKDLLKYNKVGKYFYAYPSKYNELRKTLVGLGFSLNDLTGFKDSIPLPVKASFKGSLREYQLEALNKWLNNSGRGIIALPTGSGKTHIGIAAITKINEATLIITYTKEQLTQWEKFIKTFTDIPPSHIGLYYSKEKKILPVTLATYQTAFKYIEKLAPYFNLLIIDEVHHLPAEKFKHIAITSPAKYRLGLSATPYREDGKHAELFPLMGGVVYHKTTQELAEKGFLAKFRIETIKVDLKSREKKEYLKLRKQFRELTGGLDFKTLVDLAKRGDEKAIKALEIHSEILKILSMSESKLEKVKEIVERELSEGKKIIVFAHYVALAEKIAEELGAYLLTGEMEETKRKSILDQFRRAERGVLVVTTVGDEGLDIPDASVGILVAGTGSRRQFIQRLGRLLRPKPGKEAVLYEIVIKGSSEEFQAKKRKTVSLDDLAGVYEGSEQDF